MTEAERNEFDLRETLRAVLYFWGPEGAEKVTRHVLMARRARESNYEIDEIEKALGLTGEMSEQS